MTSSLTVGSLFTGIGGLDLGLERAGMRVIWQSEIDPYASRVLAKHWTNVPNLGDIMKIDWSTVEQPDLVCGGFPCQPVSVAGRRLKQEDERWLWPEFARCLRELRPHIALLENVPGLLTGGMGLVVGDLAEMGFNAEWGCISAAACGAQHRRERIIILAYARGSGLEGLYETGWGKYLQSACRDVRTEGQWRTEPEMDRVAYGISPRVVNKRDKLKALGNAVVPQVAHAIGRTIQDARNGFQQGSSPVEQYAERRSIPSEGKGDTR